MTLDIVSLFSGVGGIDLAFERAGCTPRLLCEYDKHAAKVLALNFPDVPIFPDVQELTADDLRSAGARPERTVLLAGFPCQDLSVAGARRGMGEGTRSGLYWHVDRLLAEFRPTWVLLENVPGLLSQDDGRAMGAVLGSLAERGYGFAYRVLDAQHFGVPQRRRRVVIVGRLGDSGAAPAQVLLEPEGGGWDSPAGITSGPSTPGRTAGGAGGGRVSSLTASHGGADDNDAQAGHLVAMIVNTITAREAKGPDSDATTMQLPMTFQKVTRPATSDHPDVWEHREVAATLSPFDLGSETRAVELVVECVTGSRTHALTAEGADASEDGTGRGTPIIAATLTAGASKPGVSAPGRRQEDDHNLVAFYLTQDPISGDVAPALGAKGGGQGVHTETAVRRLTPTECERLQGHPDGWTEGVSESQRYKQMGNGVAVPVFEWVARRLVAIDNHLTEGAA